MNLRDAKLQRDHGRAVWAGPEVDGVTFSLLCRFLQCPERFRLYAIEGLRPVEGFNHRTHYGTMWHLCEECYATGRDWQSELYAHSEKLCDQYPHDRDEVDRWYRICQVQFPVYLEHWAGYEREQGLKCVSREEVFDTQYKLPSGRKVRLRGKRDGVYTDGVESYLFETKTKGDVNERSLQQQLTFDLQTMLYLIASVTETGDRIGGVYYNVVRRPCSGGKGSIVRHKARGSKPEESWPEYCTRLARVIDGTGEDTPGPGYFFHRWLIPVLDGDVKTFRRECLDPLLSRICSWWDVISGRPLDRECTLDGVKFRMPYGVSLPLLDNGVTDYDEMLRTGSRVGLEKVDNLFRELV